MTQPFITYLNKDQIYIRFLFDYELNYNLDQIYIRFLFNYELNYNLPK